MPERRTMKCAFVFAAGLFFSMTVCGAPNTLQWAGHTWHVRTGGGKPCASGVWDSRGVWVDEAGDLHLKLLEEPSGDFACAEIDSVERFGYGDYQFQVSGPIGNADPYVDFGICLYPPHDVGPDSTNELDIEFSRWGQSFGDQVYYTVWNRTHPGNRHYQFGIPDDVSSATFDLVWSPEHVEWRSSLQPDQTVSYSDDVANRPQTMIINLWLYKKTKPASTAPIEYVIKPMKVSS
jgi:beta-glucanase (GH16 family)